MTRYRPDLVEQCLVEGFIWKQLTSEGERFGMSVTNDLLVYIQTATSLRLHTTSWILV